MKTGMDVVMAKDYEVPGQLSFSDIKSFDEYVKNTLYTPQKMIVWFYKDNIHYEERAAYQTWTVQDEQQAYDIVNKFMQQKNPEEVCICFSETNHREIFNSLMDEHPDKKRFSIHKELESDFER